MKEVSLVGFSTPWCKQNVVVVVLQLVGSWKCDTLDMDASIRLIPSFVVRRRIIHTGTWVPLVSKNRIPIQCCMLRVWMDLQISFDVTEIDARLPPAN
jgi:hypothetical protein